MIHLPKTIIKNRLGIVQYPSFVTFLVTWKCNCKCIMCDVWKKKNSDDLTLKEIENIFSQLKQIDAIRISGGEPFLRKDLAEIINIIDKTTHPKIIHITTNGLLTNQIIDVLKKVKPIRKVHLKVSIDDVKSEHDKIRGINGAYDMAIRTVEKVSILRDELHFYLGVNQTIVNEKGLNAYFMLKSALSKFNVNVHAVIAYNQDTGLYSTDGESKLVNPEMSLKTFGDFSQEKLGKFIKELEKDTSGISNFEEKVLKKYHLKGLYNRLVNNKNIPKPLCVALNSHLRILPNGDIPICMYNSSIVGNLRNNKFEKIWLSEEMKKYRQWVKKCPGCWAGCEANVNAIYSGDIWRGIF